MKTFDEWYGDIGWKSGFTKYQMEAGWNACAAEYEKALNIATVNHENMTARRDLLRQALAESQARLSYVIVLLEKEDSDNEEVNVYLNTPQDYSVLKVMLAEERKKALLEVADNIVAKFGVHTDRWYVDGKEDSVAAFIVDRIYKMANKEKDDDHIKS